MNWKGSTAVAKGAENVAINVAHAASRNNFTIVLSLTNVNRSARPIVFFKLPSSGSLVRKRLEKDSQGLVFHHVKSAVTCSGYTTMGIMQEVMCFNLIFSSFILKVPSHARHNPLRGTLDSKEARGCRVGVFGSDAVHKAWMQENFQEIELQNRSSY